MGIWDRITGGMAAQFLDVIHWTDDSNDTIVWRFPIHDQAITDQSKLVVRESQAAVFVAEGRLSDVFAPGTYTLSTPNTPIWSFFKSIAYALNNPYKGDVLFVNTKIFRDQAWGTQAPFIFEDPKYGDVELRAFGNYSFRVTDPAVFIRNVVGTDGHFTVEEIGGQLKKKIVPFLASAIQRSGRPLSQLATSSAELGDAIRDAVAPNFAEQYGVTLTDVTIGNISMPEEIQEAFRQATKMRMLGGIDNYAKIQAADAIGVAAANPGMAGSAMGMGVGVGMGQMMAGMMGAMTQPSAAPPPAPGMAPPPPPTAATFHYSGPQGQSQGTADQIAAAVLAAPTAQHHVWAPGWAAWKNAQEVPEIAAKLAVPPPPPPR
jgi:membrane protease subunit (stomatin/prohibitin family)